MVPTPARRPVLPLPVSLTLFVMLIFIRLIGISFCQNTEKTLAVLSPGLTLPGGQKRNGWRSQRQLCLGQTIQENSRRPVCSLFLANEEDCLAPQENFLIGLSGLPLRRISLNHGERWPKIPWPGQRCAEARRRQGESVRPLGQDYGGQFRSGLRR